MSNCTFAIIEKEEVKLFSGHYSLIRSILKRGNYGKLSECRNIYDFRFSDTFIFPCVCIDFDNKILYDTALNGFANFQNYMPDGWEYKEMK